MEQWDKNYYITSVAGAINGSALVVMSQGEWRTHIFPLFLSLHSVYINFSKSNILFIIVTVTEFHWFRLLSNFDSYLISISMMCYYPGKSIN